MFYKDPYIHVQKQITALAKIIKCIRKGDCGKVSSITNVIGEGHLIAKHNDGNGNKVDIKETITSLSLDGDIISYVKEDGSVDKIDVITDIKTRVNELEDQDDNREQEILGVKRTVERLTTKVNDLAITEQAQVSAGSNKTVSLAGERRLDKVVLIGSATTFNRMIPSIIWEKVSGDDDIIISHETSLNPIISNLLEGVYVIKITARYNEDTEAEATMTLTVNN